MGPAADFLPFQAAAQNALQAQLRQQQQQQPMQQDWEQQEGEQQQAEEEEQHEQKGKREDEEGQQFGLNPGVRGEPRAGSARNVGLLPGAGPGQVRMNATQRVRQLTKQMQMLPLLLLLTKQFAS